MIPENQYFSLSLNIPFDQYNKDFTFIVKGKKFETPRIIADLLSPIIAKYHHTDKKITEYTIKSHSIKQNKSIEDENEDYFQDFLNLPNFQEQELDENRRKKYSEYFLELGNISEYLNLEQKSYQNLNTVDNVLTQLKQLCKIQELILNKQELQSSDILSDLFQ